MKSYNITSVFAAALFWRVRRTRVRQQKFVTIGTGGVTGVYYAAGARCADRQQGPRKARLRCSVESTEVRCST
jgi:TRAP-type uncharacterized transport system substrate-binding protein